VRRISEINTNQLPKCELQVKTKICSRQHNQGPTLINCRGTQFEEIRLQNHRLQRTKPNNCVIVNKRDVVFIKNIVENPTGCFIIGNSFHRTEHLFEKPLKSGILNIFSVAKSTELRYWPISHITSKAIALPIDNCSSEAKSNCGME
jgi:hypothetical protein